MNNQPSMLQAIDFQAGHSDMLVAARGEPLTKEQIERLRSWRPWVLLLRPRIGFVKLPQHSAAMEG